VGRSGTTLLQAMLNAHPDISFLPEIHFIRNGVINQVLSNIYKKHGKDGILTEFRENRQFKRLKIPEASLIEDIRGSSDVAGQIHGNIIRFYRTEKGAKWIGEKEPRAIEWLKPLSHLYPSIKWIQIIRDPRDVLLSKQKAAWSQKRPSIIHIMIGAYQLELYKRAVQSESAMVYNLRYEKLINDPQDELKKLASFLGVPYSDTMVEYHKNAGELIADDERAWKENVFKPVVKNNTDKWKTGLSSFQIALVQQVVTFPFQELNYKKEKIPLGISVLAKLISLPLRMLISIMVARQLRRSL